MVEIIILFALSTWGICLASGYISGSPPFSRASQGGRTRKYVSSVVDADAYRAPNIMGKATRNLSSERANAGILSKLTFGWARSMMMEGNNKVLDIEDLWRLEENHLMDNVSTTFDHHFEIAMTEANVTAGVLPPLKGNNVVSKFSSSPLIRAVVKMYRREFIVSGVTKFFNTFVQFLPSLVVARILANVDKQAGTEISLAALKTLRIQGVALALLLVSLLSTKTFLENQYFYTVIQLGADIRNAISSAIYRKALKLSPSGRMNNTVGEIVNYMQLDTNRMEQVAGSIHTLWDGLFQVIGYTSLLLYYLGPSVFAGIAAMLVIIPFNAFFLKRLSDLRAANLKMTDQRVKLTNEMFQGIRAIKSYAWEKAFADQLISIRKEEIRTLKACANVRAILVSMLSASPSIVAVVVLGLYALLGNSLTPVKVFTALALFNQLRFPLIFLPILLNNLTEGALSLERLSKFFSADEVVDYVERVPTTDKSSPAVRIKGGDFSWIEGEGAGEDSQDGAEKKAERGSLNNINVQIKEGELVAVVGPVGSGKSSLVSAILGELYKAGGEVAVKGSVAYVSQTAWIPNDSLKNVVLFGNDYEEKRYRRVIEDCGLSRDIEILEAGDETEIGERAVNLSGGQKQRLNLARAVYDDADIYLLDDPLSALDSDVGARVFRDCVKGSLGGKTRILITHQLKVLPEVDRVVIMAKDDDGACSVLDQGTFSELVARGHDLSKVLKREERSDESAEGDKKSASLEDAPSAIAETVTAEFATAAGTETMETENLPHAKPVIVNVEATEVPDPDTLADCVQEKEMSVPPRSAAEPVKLMSVEERAAGAVELQTYRSYIKAANSPMLLALILASFGFANASQQGQQWVVAAWTGDADYVKRPLQVYLAGVSLMAAGVAFFNWSRTFLGAFFGAGASEEMHREMVTSVLRAPLNFFESTPVGRLVQRFTRDLDQIDQQLPGSFGQFVASTLAIISAMLAVSVVTPSFAIFGVPILVVYLFITNFYRQVARELKRLDSVSRSPIFAHFGESLDGLPVIRSFRRQGMFRRGNEVRLEDSNTAYYALKVVDRWLSVRLELLGNMIVFFSALLVVLAKARAGTSGLSINNALGVTGLLNWAVRNGAELESLMNSVERVRYTTYQTPQEKTIPASSFLNMPVEQQGSVTTEAQVGPGWPWKGGVRFENVGMRYRSDFQPVLRGVNLNVKPGEMVGIVGRTGSGKSSLFRALLRLTELEKGAISIDGVDISRVDLEMLRSSVAIIPQEPVLFSGSIRRNLDPFGSRSDEELWTALRRSNLESTIRSLQGGLDFEVSEGGENFSLGQRQLLCLARALVRKSRVLLLDEATSSIDYSTDLIIQRTIREEASRSGCTVITIAHRLDTIMDSDRVLVMDNGAVAEFDTPSNLLSRPQSLLSSLVEAERRQSEKTQSI